MRMPAALFLLLLPGLAAAEPAPTCVQRMKKGLREPATLQALLDCQKKKLDVLILDYEEKHGDGPSDEAMESWEERQREEVRDYIRRHPERSVREGPAEAPSGKKAAGKPAELEDLQKELGADSDEGRKGVTPVMAKKIVKAIEKQQGYVSQEMADLLEALQKDDVNLSDASMRKLKEASRQADADGLDLGVDADLKDYLLEKGTR